MVDPNKHRSCELKRRFDTEREAKAINSGGAYRCVYCGFWHNTTGGIRKLLEQSRHDEAVIAKRFRADRYVRKKQKREIESDYARLTGRPRRRRQTGLGED